MRGFRDPRYRIEHSQVVAQPDFARYKQLGVIASMQPNHLLTDMNWAEQRLGSERAKGSYAWKSFLDAGVPLAFGTDYPVEPITPFRCVYAAVTRMNEAGTMTYHPEQKITIWQALYAYTQGSAYAEFDEKTKGKLAVGYDADYVILDRNLLTVHAPEILKTEFAREMWAQYQQGELTADSRLSGVFARDETPPDADSVLVAVEDAREEALRRELGRES